LSNSRDNLQQNSPPRRRSKRNGKKLSGAINSNENSQVTKSHGHIHENKIEGGKRGTNKKGKNKSKSKNSFTKLPTYRQSCTQPPEQAQTTLPSTGPRVPGIKDYVDMVMTDLSTRPPLWYFSSYGLSLNPIQSLSFPHLGTVELSAEELRLQVYAEAAATGGRIDNYVKVVGDIKEKAESVTKALIPNLERIVSETLSVNNIPIPIAGSYQDTLRQTLEQRASLNFLSSTGQTNILAVQPSYSTTTAAPPLPLIPQHEPLFQHPTIQHQPQPQHQIHQSNQIIPDDSFAFGMIPEIPPE
jgi:hypothetical protein